MVYFYLKKCYLIYFNWNINGKRKLFANYIDEFTTDQINLI